MAKCDVDERTVKIAALLPPGMHVFDAVREQGMEAPDALPGGGGFNRVNRDSSAPY
jgi:hypothetical protein